MNLALTLSGNARVGMDLLGGLSGGLVCGVAPAWELVLGARDGDIGVRVSRTEGERKSGRWGVRFDPLSGGIAIS